MPKSVCNSCGSGLPARFHVLSQFKSKAAAAPFTAPVDLVILSISFQRGMSRVAEEAHRRTVAGVPPKIAPEYRLKAGAQHPVHPVGLCVGGQCQKHGAAGSQALAHRIIVTVGDEDSIRDVRGNLVRIPPDRPLVTERCVFHHDFQFELRRPIQAGEGNLNVPGARNRSLLEIGGCQFPTERTFPGRVGQLPFNASAPRVSGP